MGTMCAMRAHSRESVMSLMRLLMFCRRGPPHLRPLQTPLELGGAPRASAKKGPFLYSPFAKKMVRVEPITWVCGEMAEATIILANPLSFPLHIDKMTLRCGQFPSKLDIGVITGSPVVPIGLLFTS